MPCFAEPGDYWFAMVHDFITTDTPWFHNLYEFNTTSDEDRKTTRAFFLPMSLVYSAGAIISPAFGYNLTIWASPSPSRRRPSHGNWKSAPASLSTVLA